MKKLLFSLVFLILLSSFVSAVVPTHTTPILNATDNPFNRTSANLTVYNQSTADVDGNNVTNIINWYRDGTSITLLNTPFDHDNSAGAGKTKDYSPYENNGTVTLGTWSATGSEDGNNGGYVFAGVSNNRINFGTDNRFNFGSNPFSVETRVKLSTASGDRSLVGKGQPAAIGGAGWWLVVQNNDDVWFCRNLNGIANECTIPLSAHSKDDLLVNVWYHIIVTINSSGTAIIYVDGIPGDPNTRVGAIRDSTDPLLFGIYGNLAHGDFGGVVEYIKIYNYSLSPEQVLALDASRTDLIVSQETTKGEIWKACITPNDGIGDGATNCSNNLTILNTPPTQTKPILNSTYGTNYTNENLAVYNQSTYDADGDNVINRIRWFINSVENITFENLTTINSIYTNKGETWKACITPNDGYDNGVEICSNNLIIIPFCVDNDGDGFGSANISDCIYPNILDCNDNNADVIPPYDGYQINRSVTLCDGTYNINTTNAVLNISGDDVILTCNSTTMFGNGNKYAIQMIGRDNITIKDCTINNYSRAIYGTMLSNINILNNSFSDSFFPIVIENISNAVIEYNTITDSNSNMWARGIYLKYIDNIILRYNTIYDSPFAGVVLEGPPCSNNLVEYNTMNNSGFVSVVAGMCNNTIIRYNNFSGSRGVVGFEETGYGIVGFSSNNMSIYGNRIWDNDAGILLTCLNECYIYNNILWDNDYGIYHKVILDMVGDKGVYYNNTFSNGIYGVMLMNSSYNKMYNNTFTNFTYGLYLNITAYNNIFYHNYFYNIGKEYVHNNMGASDGNEFNTTVGGVAQGNYYDDITSWSILDTDADGYGDSGVDYPYNLGQTKWSGVGADWGPITSTVSIPLTIPQEYYDVTSGLVYVLTAFAVVVVLLGAMFISVVVVGGKFDTTAIAAATLAISVGFAVLIALMFVIAGFFG